MHEIRDRLKRRLSQSLVHLVYPVYMLQTAIRRVRRRGTKKLGLVTFEFFRKDLNGFGGFGKLAQNVSSHCNQQGNGFRADVLLAMAAQDHGYRKRCHDAEVIFKFVNQGSLMRNVRHYAAFRTTLLARRLDVLVTIDYSTRYESFVFGLPHTPLVIWLQDPRGPEQWQRMAEVSRFDVESARESSRRLISETRQSLHRLLEESRRLGRPVRFAHQAECLVPRAASLYGLPIPRSEYLPNPVTIPPTVCAKESRPTVCFLARLHPIKRPWIYCELAKRFPGVTFLAAGPTHGHPGIEALIKQYRQRPNLRFLGLIDGEEKCVLLQRSWVLVNTSVTEGLPVSFLEAFACGTPVLSSVDPDRLVSRFGAYTGEISGDGDDQPSIERFADGLARLLENDRWRQETGQLAREYVQRTHSFQHFDDCLTRICEPLW